MEEDDSDSDCTVLLIDFVNEPQKVDAKRRRLSHLQDRSKQAGHDDENAARNDVSQNIQTDLPKNNIEKNWLITKYLSGINKANIRNNTSNENAPKYALVSKTYAGNTENTAKFNDIVICLDSDDETESNEKSQNQDTNKGLTEISSANDLLHETKLIVLKPAAINARRPTTNIFESNQMFSNEHMSQRPKGNEPARLKVLKRSIINERKATTHFEENNLKRNSSNGKENMSKNDKMESGNSKLADKDSYRFIPPRLSPLESNIPNTTSSTSSGTNAGIRVASQAENSLTSILTVSNNKLNTTISDSTIIDNKDFQQDTENKTVANIKAKRYGNNETQIEPKRIKMNLKPKCSVKQHADTEQMINEKCKANVMCEEISNEEIGQELREHETCDRDKQDRSKMQENRDETVRSEANIEPVTFKDKDSANEELNAGAIKILNKTTLSTTNEAQESKQVQNELEIIKVQNGQIKSKACDKQETNNLSSKNQKTSQVVNETAPTEANTEPETFEDQDSANEVLNTEGAIKLLDKTTLSTTSEAQESKQVQNELEIIKVQNRQINSEACDKHETNKIYEEQRTIETLNREDKEEETRQVSGEQTTNESHTKQGTDQLNKTQREVSLNLEDNKRGLKFQIFFLTYILENLIKDEYPQFGITLQNIIKTLLINARHGSFQTHVQYACPECGCLSNYSSNLSKTKSGVNNTENSQNCDLCRGVGVIHTSYLEKYSNKKYHIGVKKENVESTPAKNNNAKQLVEESDKSVTRKTSSNSKAILEEIDTNDSVSRCVVEDICAVDKEKQTDNISSTQSALETKTENHNNSKEHAINSGTPFIEASETKTEGKIKITNSSNMNEIVSIKDKLTISNKRTNEIDEQSVIHKRMKTVTESNKTQNEENLKTKDNSSYLTTDFHSAIENNKKIDQATQIYSNLAVELPKNISLIQNVIPSIGSSRENNKASCSKRDNISNLVNPVAVVSNSDADLNRDLRSAQNVSNTAVIASSESPVETHTHTTNLNTQEMSLKLKSHSDNIITAETDQLKTKSDNNSNEVANEKPIDPTSQNVLRVEVEENDKHIENSCNKSAISDKVHEHNQSIIKSLVENPQLNNNVNEEEGSHVAQEKDKTVLDLASKESFSTDKLISGATIAYKYICPHCTSTYTHPSKLLRHLKNEYNVIVTKIPKNCIRLQCPFCDYLLHQKSYNKHVARCRSAMHENTNVNKEENENHSKIKNVRAYSSGKNEQFETSKLIRFKYFCSICDEKCFTTDYAAARQHRTQFHSEFKHHHVIKKIRIGIKSNNEQEEKQNDDSEDPVADNVDNSNTNCGNVDGASEPITTENISNQTTTNSRKIRKPSTSRDMSCNKDEERCDSDETSSKSSDEDDDDKRDENKTKTLHTSGEGTSTNKNANSTSKRQTYTFICELCNQMLYSDYARRKHRIHQHPNIQGRAIFKKIKNVEPKGNASKPKNESKKFLEDNNSSSSTDRVTNVEQVNSTRDGKLRKRCKANKGENASDSDWSPVSNSDCFDESSTRERKAHKNKRCTGNTETVSEDEIIKASDYLTRRRKKRTTKLFGAERQGLRATTLQKTAASEESDSDWIVSDENSHESADSFDEMKYCDSQNTGIDESTDNEMEEDYDSQKTDVRESNDDSNLTTDEEYLPVSNNKTLITSMRTSKKRKQSFLKFVNDSIDTDETDGDQQVASEESDNELLTGPDNQCDNNEIASESFGEERLSEDEIIKVSENTRKKRKERMSTLFDDDIEISLLNNDGNAQEQNNETNNSTNHIISVVDKSGNKDVEINKSHAERPDLRKGENGLENFINVADHQVQNKEVYYKTNDRDLATESTNTTVVSEQNNTSKLSNVILRDDDRLEIDLIDCLLKEYNTRDEQRNDSCTDKAKDGEDNRDPDIHNDQTGANIDNQPLLPPEINNCLENIQITNVRSIANKLYIFICQECSYATDTYDDTIRHCQNHYNHIEDPVTYCNICQIKYDSSCFERHEISHDKYLINIKIKFSYQWLFSNWPAVFENNHILLGEAEDMQVQSIYKTHCVNMTVKEHGPWQSALYLCAKCNIFVPPLDIEKHVQEKCTLTYYACAICHRAFLTHEMREHHKIYHTDDVTQPFKTIVFNEKKYERFNSTLIQIKLQLAQNKEKQRIVEIYKCICGLCFVTLRKFKLHFVDCESDTNDGVQCTMCSGLRRFLPSDLEIHMSLHHSATKYEFRVQQITFQEERDYDSSEPLESTTDNNVEDLNIKNEMLKDETLSQGDRNINQEDSEILSSLEGRVQQMSINADSDINIEVTKNELLSQNTNDNIDTIEGNINMNSIADNSAQIMFTADDVNFKRDFKKRDSKKTLDISKEDFANKIRVVNATQIESNVEDLNIKQEMLKNEVSSQNTIEENIQEYTKDFEEHLESVASEQLLVIDKDLNNKKDMLKDESFSQNTNEKNSQQSQDVIEENLMKKTATTIDDAAQINSNVEDLITKTDVLKDKTLSENTIEESTEEKTEISEKAEQNRSSTNILLVIQGHNIKGDMLKNELTTQNTNIDIQNRLHMEDFVNNIENPTQEIFSSVALNVHSLKSGVNNEEKNLENKNAVVDLETENSKVVESEDAIVIEDSDDGDVELIGVVNRVFNIRQFFRSGY